MGRFFHVGTNVFGWLPPKVEFYMWAACIGYSDNLETHRLVVTETEKQYQIDRRIECNKKAGQAIGYASVINKVENKRLFESEEEALWALNGTYEYEYSHLRDKAEKAKLKADLIRAVIKEKFGA